MSKTRQRCPSPADLERGYWTDDATTRLHASGCDACGPQWADIAGLAALARRVEAPAPASDRQSDIRAALLSRPAAVPRAPWWRHPAVVPATAAVAAAAVVLLVLWPAPRTTAPPTPPVLTRAEILAHPGASFMVASPQPDEIVRLVHGTLSIDVAPLADGERFRVLTGDGEVEVVGTAFDVTAEDDALTAVRVLHGTVRVTIAGDVTTLTAGDTWTATIALAPPTPTPTPPPSPPPSPSPPPPPSRRVPPPHPSPTGEGDRAAIVGTVPDAAPAVPARSASQQAFDRAWTALRAGAFDVAAEEFERVTDDPETRLAEDARYWRAVALARAGKDATATRAFEAFLSAHPESPHTGEASAMLGWILLERGDVTAAARRFRTALQDDDPRVRASAAEGLRGVRRARPAAP